ncbi:hypothetical protein N8T08_005644 [Aspergillus melleus]|uniref:Uncharacterized protein n=1 Tax=Aspergillus melleus TaxID=138277 RepID=A0ACC3B2I2_9EURO|nr:hypothetical protein N8T08_005644 [Aspergillus melleus]
MSFDTPILIPSGYSPPFEVVDDLHHGAWVIIATALGLVVALVSFLIRVYVRIALNPPFAVDDGVLLVVAVIQSTLLFLAVSKGFGTAMDLLSVAEVNVVQKLITTSDILYLITIYITKVCVVGIHLRLTPQKRHNQLAWATLGLCTAWIVTALFLVTVNCELNEPWKGTGAECVNLLPRWQFIVSIDIFTEVLLFGLAVALLAGLFMPLKRKIAIGCAFMFRLPLVNNPMYIPPHIPNPKPAFLRRHPRLRVPDHLGPGRARLFTSRVQRVLSEAVYGGREYELWDCGG